MKDLHYFDHRHNYVYTVKNAKNRKDARRIVYQNIIGNIWYSTVEKQILDSSIFEIEKTLVFQAKSKAKAKQ